jgi:hypothetical protein
MVVIASVCEDGLGLTSWWQSEADGEDDDNEDEDETLICDSKKLRFVQFRKIIVVDIFYHYRFRWAGGHVVPFVPIVAAG